MDNPFELLTSGQADWDSDVIANFNVLERGYHVTERAGQAISSGQILTLNSGGFFFPYNSGSASVAPHAMAYTAAASGDSLTALAWGIVRSLSISSAAVPGKLMFSNASGFLSTTTAGFAVGVGLTGNGLLFNPAKVPSSGAAAAVALASLTDVNTSGVADGLYLKWSDASSRWVPATVPGATPQYLYSTPVNFTAAAYSTGSVATAGPVWKPYKHFVIDRITAVASQAFGKVYVAQLCQFDSTFHITSVVAITSQYTLPTSGAQNLEFNMSVTTITSGFLYGALVTLLSDGGQGRVNILNSATNQHPLPGAPLDVSTTLYSGTVFFLASTVTNVGSLYSTQNAAGYQVGARIVLNP